ncbi:MAG: ATP-binding protein [Bryobacterales bacterium]
MWTSEDESSLWGALPYRVAIPVLLILALLLTALLVVSLERWHSALGELLDGHPQGDLRNDLIKLAIMVVLLGATAVVSLAILQHYRGAQHALSRAQELSRQTLENMVSGIVTLDWKGRITVANPAARAMLNLGSHHNHNLAWLLAKHGQVGAIAQMAVEKESYQQDVDVDHVSQKLGKIWLRVTTWPLVVGQARVGVVVMLTDVTRILAVEKQLRRLDRLAATETLAAGVAHEVRNPLTAIDLNLRLLRDEVTARLNGAAGLEDYFDILSEETARLNRITEDFLEFSRPRSAEGHPVSVGDVLQRVARLLDVEAKEKRIHLRLGIGPDLPLVSGDAERLEQVFLNLFVNAMAAMPAGGEIDASVDLLELNQKPAVEVIITDQGPGVSREQLPRLFDPYFTTKPGGTGLGLAIAHRIVADHDGDITLENGVSGGLSVRVRLPACDSGLFETQAAGAANHECESDHR